MGRSARKAFRAKWRISAISHFQIGSLSHRLKESISIADPNKHNGFCSSNIHDCRWTRSVSPSIQKTLLYILRRIDTNTVDEHNRSEKRQTIWNFKRNRKLKKELIKVLSICRPALSGDLWVKFTCAVRCFHWKLSSCSADCRQRTDDCIWVLNFWN